MIEIDNFTKSDFQPYNDDYVYIPIKPKVHQQHSRKIMDKMIQKYFNKVEETALNPTRVFGNKWQSLKATYDTYMGLTPNERRRVDVSNMRGYQFDKNSKKLYSFEDNCVYNVTVADKFNKIVVVSKDHLLSDTEKRAVFDNPFQFEPISPYRITWPTSTIRDMKDLSIIEINKSVDKLSDTMNAFTTNMNTVMDNISSTTSALQMTSLDLATNIVDIHSILEDISTTVRGISDKQEEQNQLHLDGYQQTIQSITDLQDKITRRIDEEVPALTDLNNAFTSLSSSIMNRESQLDEQIGTLINAQKDVFKKSEDTIAALQERIDPGHQIEIAEVTPRVDPEVLKGIHSMNSFFDYFKDQYYEYLSNMLQANNALIQSISEKQNQQSEALTIIAGTNYQTILQQLQAMNNGIEQSYNHYNPLLENMIQTLQQQSANTQQLLTDATQLAQSQIELQRDNQQLLTDMQTDNRNMLGVINQNVVNGNQQRDAQMQMINNLQDQQSYLNWLVQNGFNEISSMVEQLYQSYIALQNRIPQLQFGNNNTPLLNDNPISPLLLTNDNTSIAPTIVETANTIAPVIESIDRITSENQNTEHINTKDVIRDDFISFLNILANNRDNVLFMEKCQEYGLRLLFNSYRVRNSDSRIFTFFVRLANGVITNHEIEEGFEYLRTVLVNMQPNPEIDQLIVNVIRSVLTSNRGLNN